MPSQKNVEAVAQLKDLLSRSSVVIGTSFTGLNGEAMTSLRRALRQKGIEYRVVKNTVTAIAAEEIGRPQIKGLLQGATGLVLGYADPVEAAQALNEYLRASRLPLTVHGVVIDREVLGPNGVTTLADLPSSPRVGRAVHRTVGGAHDPAGLWAQRTGTAGCHGVEQPQSGVGYGNAASPRTDGGGRRLAALAQAGDRRMVS